MVDKVYEAMKNVKFTPFNIQTLRIRRFSQPQLSPCCLGRNDRRRGATQKHFHSAGTSDSRVRVCGGRLRVQPTLNHCAGKVGRNKQRLAELVTKKGDFEFGIIKADCLRLKRSQLSPKGPTYSTTKRSLPSTWSKNDSHAGNRINRAGSPENYASKEDRAKVDAITRELEQKVSLACKARRRCSDCAC